jgi:hypothetical protein
LDLDFKPQSLDSKDLVCEPQAARGSRPGPGARLETPIFGSEEPGLRPRLGTSRCNRVSGLQTLNLGFEEEEEGLKEVGTGLGNLKLHIDKQTDRHHLCFNIEDIGSCNVT